MIVFVLSLLLPMALSEDWRCWDEPAHVVRYADTNNVVDLPHYSTMIASWDSAIITAWAAKILLKEKMGVELDWWCTDDPLLIHSPECDDNYPISMWDDVQSGEYDVYLEAWQVQAVPAGHLDRVYQGKILDIGALGSVGTAFLYTADYDKTWSLGHWIGLKDQTVKNTVFTEMKPIFDEYKSKGILMTWSTPWTEPGAVELEQGPDIYADASTVITKPFILCAGHDYVITRAVRDLMGKKGLFPEWELWVVDFENNLSEILDRCYAEKRHFVANMWAPGYDLGSFQKQRIGWEVPQVEGCSANMTCDQPMESLFKIANPVTLFKIPEVAEFFKRFRVPSSVAVNKMIFNKHDEGISYEQAACNWLKANPDEWTSFIVPIIRTEIQEAWYVLYVQIGAIIFAVIALIFIVWQVWKCVKPSIEKESRVEAYVREGKAEMAILAMYIVLDFGDVLSTCYSTFTCFEVAGEQVLLIVSFCACLVLEVVFFVIIQHQRFKLAKESLDKINGRFTMTKDEFQMQSTIRKTSKVFFNKQKLTKSEMEFLTFIAGLGEDLPTVALYTAVFLMGYTEPSFVIGAVMSCAGFGYKVASLEKMTIWMKKTPFVAEPSNAAERSRESEERASIFPESDVASKKSQ